MVLDLNIYQKEAIQNALKNELFLIHGPFGTGKTTVLVYLILELIKKGKKILVTADSNAAVDNIVEKLSKYTQNFVRIGNPSKIMEKSDILKYSLEEVIKKEELFRKIKELKDSSKVSSSENSTPYSRAFFFIFIKSAFFKFSGVSREISLKSKIIIGWGSKFHLS